MTFLSSVYPFTDTNIGLDYTEGKDSDFLYPYINQGLWEQAIAQRPNIYDEEYNERRWTHELNVEAPLSLTSWLSAKLKTGMKYSTMKRVSKPTVYGSTVPYESTPGGLNKYIMDIIPDLENP